MNQPISIEHVKGLLGKNGVRARVEYGEVRKTREPTIFLLPGDPVGHFVCTFENGEGLNYFDPYGDEKAGYVSDGHAYQKEEYYGGGSEVVNTCGRHCVYRLKHKDLTREEYRRMVGPHADLQVYLYV